MQDKQATQRHECLFTIIMSLKRKLSVLSTILRLEKVHSRYLIYECRIPLHYTRVEPRKITLKAQSISCNNAQCLLLTLGRRFLREK